VAVIRNHGGLFEGPAIARDFDVIAFTTDLNHWGDRVRLSMKPHGRHAQCEFAGAKITSWAQNLTWYEEAHQRGFDEVLLLNERGEVSECTSANVFALQGGQVSTPPLNSGCLPGITRQVLLEEIHIPGITIVEQTLMPADLQEANQVFITSSTRDLLAVSEIEGLAVKSEGLDVVDALVKAFGQYRDAYVQQSIARKLDKVTA
jgi:branched-chain amino acid aminotransferase